MKHFAFIATLGLLVSSAAYAASPHSSAPSINCEKATSRAEKLVCSSQNLSVLDARLMQIYKQLLNDSSDKSSLKKEQREWVRQRDACEAVDCIEKAYQDRIEDLESTRNYLSKPAEFR